MSNSIAPSSTYPSLSFPTWGDSNLINFSNYSLNYHSKSSLDLDTVTKPYTSEHAQERYRKLSESTSHNSQTSITNLEDSYASTNQHVTGEEHNDHDTTNLDTVIFLFLCIAVG